MTGGVEIIDDLGAVLIRQLRHGFEFHHDLVETYQVRLVSLLRFRRNDTFGGLS
jgi:hypothetical protein